MRKSLVLAGFSNTVTAVLVPEGTTFNDIFNIMLSKHNVLIAGSYDIFQGEVFRIGHMGENCSMDKVFVTLRALNCTLSSLGVNLRAKIHEELSKLF